MPCFRPLVVNLIILCNKVKNINSLFCFSIVVVKILSIGPSGLEPVTPIGKSFALGFSDYQLLDHNDVQQQNAAKEKSLKNTIIETIFCFVGIQVSYTYTILLYTCVILMLHYMHHSSSQLSFVCIKCLSVLMELHYVSK